MFRRQCCRKIQVSQAIWSLHSREFFRAVVHESEATVYNRRFLVVLFPLQISWKISYGWVVSFAYILVAYIYHYEPFHLRGNRARMVLFSLKPRLNMSANRSIYGSSLAITCQLDNSERFLEVRFDFVISFQNTFPLLLLRVLPPSCQFPNLLFWKR